MQKVEMQGPGGRIVVWENAVARYEARGYTRCGTPEPAPPPEQDPEPQPEADPEENDDEVE